MTLFYLKDKYNLDSLEQNILNYLYENIDNIKKIGIRTVAKDNFTSTATIYKLVKKLGFDGYADMIYSLYYDNLTNAPNNLSHNKNNSYSHIQESINPIKNQFLSYLKKYKNKQIVVTGMGFSQIIADYICESLFLKGFKITSKFHIQLLDESNKDDILLIAISKSGDTPRLIELVHKAKENNIEAVTFTGFKNNKLNKISDLPITIGITPKLTADDNIFFGELLIAFELLISNL